MTTKWPFVWRKDHEKIVAELEAAIDQEYHRATVDGCNKVREWAVDANYRIFNLSDGPIFRNTVYAAFQDAIGRFSPTRLVPIGRKQ